MKRKSNQKGQALIELIIFLPLMLMFYTMIAGFANAINGSINQQKIARAYFYYRVQGNSTVPKPGRDDNDNLPFMNWKTFGMFFIGWMDYMQGNKPMAPCYKLTVPLQAATSDTCETEYSSPTSQYIRVQTVYGICGATYERFDSEAFSIPDYRGADFAMLIGEQSCLITQ